MKRKTKLKHHDNIKQVKLQEKLQLLLLISILDLNHIDFLYTLDFVL